MPDANARGKNIVILSVEKDLLFVPQASPST
jgi:hypothetical protein